MFFNQAGGGDTKDTVGIDPHLHLDLLVAFHLLLSCAFLLLRILLLLIYLHLDRDFLLHLVLSSWLGLCLLVPFHLLLSCAFLLLRILLLLIYLHLDRDFLLNLMFFN